MIMCVIIIDITFDNILPNRLAPVAAHTHSSLKYTEKNSQNRSLC